MQTSFIKKNMDVVTFSLTAFIDTKKPFSNTSHVLHHAISMKSQLTTLKMFLNVFVNKSSITKFSASRVYSRVVKTKEREEGTRCVGGILDWKI